MAEYIDREALIQAFWDDIALGNQLRYSDTEELIKNAPAADVAPVVHGRWIPSGSDFDDDDVLFDVEEWCDWQCSACHDEICYEDPMERRWLPKFCNNCGAKMDLKD